MVKIKLDAKELRKKSVEDLKKLKLELEKRIMKNKSKRLLTKGSNVKEDRRSIARINTIIQEKNGR